MVWMWIRGIVKGEALHTEMGVCQIEIPTIITFQIQRLLGSEQRNNKFNHIKGKRTQKEKEIDSSLPFTKEQFPTDFFNEVLSSI